MVPMTRLRKTKRTVGVNQLLTRVQIEGTEETESSNMVVVARENEEMKIVVAEEKKK